MKKFLIPLIVVLAVTGYQSLFIVQEINQAIVLQFGDPKKIINKPGLNFKLPFIQNVAYLDRRVLNLDTPPEEVIAADQKRLIVDAFARFRIVDPLKFYISVGNESVARQRLATIINSRIRGVLGTQNLATLLSIDRSKHMATIQNDVNTEAKNFGITIVDVRIKRADLPQANSEAIFKRMQTEREREAKEFRAQGAEMAAKITSTADKEVTVILANANKSSEIMKGEDHPFADYLSGNSCAEEEERRRQVEAEEAEAEEARLVAEMEEDEAREAKAYAEAAKRKLDDALRKADLAGKDAEQFTEEMEREKREGLILEREPEIWLTHPWMTAGA